MDTPSGDRPNLPADVPPEALPFLAQAGYLEPDRLAVGAPAPDPPLWTMTGTPFLLSRLRGVQPMVLIFGSYT